jgi:hypothetical protein
MSLRVLDMDLDFFLDRIAYGRHGRRRLNKRHFHPWSLDEVRDYLKTQCRLCRTARIPGRFITTHDEAFGILIDLASQHGKVDMVHLDAHADLGLSVGDSSWAYIVEKLLAASPEDRVPPSEGGAALREGNYLAYAVARQLVSRLTYVCHPDVGDDLMRVFFRSGVPETEVIEIPYVPRLAEAIRHWLPPPEIVRMAERHEPPVPFRRVEGRNFKTEHRFDFGILCHSPAYTPATSDVLIPVFSEYIDFDDSRCIRSESS